MIFKVTNPFGQVVIFGDRNYHHMVQWHPEMAGQEHVIKQLIEDPESVYKSKDFPDTRHVYYVYNGLAKRQGYYLAAIVEHSPAPSIVVNAYPQPFIHGVHLEGGPVYVRPKR